MTYRMQQVLAFALVFGIAPLASASWALAQPAPEGQQIPPPASEAIPRTDPNRRGGMDSPMDRRHDAGRDERRLGGRLERDEGGFDRWGRDRDYGRDRGQWRGREFAREENDWIRPPIMGHDRMMMSHAWLMRICSPNGDRIATLMLERLERITQPTEAQRAAFDALKNAATQASEIARAGCPTDTPITPPGRLASAEKRLEALLQAVRTVRPAMDSFYGSLSDEQKARLLIAQARPWGWDRRQERRETGGRIERRDERRFDEDRSERPHPGAGRWRDEDFRPRRGWRTDDDDDAPRRYYDRDQWQDESR